MQWDETTIQGFSSVGENPVFLVGIITIRGELKDRIVARNQKKGCNNMEHRDDPFQIEQHRHHRKSHHSEKTKNNLISRLNRIEGQIRGIRGMIEKDVYCDDVLNQISAVQSALNSVGKLLLEGHLKSCVVERIQSGDHEVIDELLTTVNKLIR
jgi:DNA-binding FrmR family transcriptional regulator